MTASSYFSIITIAVLAGIILGCTGPEGPAGRDAVGADVTPPVVRLALPEAGDTLRDTLVALAQAIDNVGIERVVFYLDGSDRVTDSTVAWTTEPPYRYRFILPEMGLRAGPHTVAARAYDVAQNSAMTPSVIVYYTGEETESSGSLRNYDPDSEDYDPWPIVDHGEQSHPWYFVRFIPARACSLEKVWVLIDSIPGDTMKYSRMTFSIYRSDGAYPTDSLSSRNLQVANFETMGFGNWFEIRFPDTLRFQDGEQFHLLFGIQQPDTATHVAVGAEVKDPYVLPLSNTSGVWVEEEQRWRTFQEIYRYDYGAYEFYAEAVVGYREER